MSSALRESPLFKITPHADQMSQVIFHFSLAAPGECDERLVEITPDRFMVKRASERTGPAISSFEPAVPSRDGARTLLLRNPDLGDIQAAFVSGPSLAIAERLEKMYAEVGVRVQYVRESGRIVVALDGDEFLLDCEANAQDVLCLTYLPPEIRKSFKLSRLALIVGESSSEGSLPISC